MSVFISKVYFSIFRAKCWNLFDVYTGIIVLSTSYMTDNPVLLNMG